MSDNTEQKLLSPEQIRLYYEGNKALGCFDSDAAEQYWRDVPMLLTHIANRDERIADLKALVDDHPRMLQMTHDSAVWGQAEQAADVANYVLWLTGAGDSTSIEPSLPIEQIIDAAKTILGVKGDILDELGKCQNKYGPCSDHCGQCKP